MAQVRSTLALIRMGAGRYADAEAEIRLAMDILVKAMGPDHPALVRPFINLAVIERHLGGLSEAEATLKTARTIAERRLGPAHPRTVEVLTEYATLLKSAGRKREAGSLEKLVKSAQAEQKDGHPGQYTVDVAELRAARVMAAGK